MFNQLSLPSLFILLQSTVYAADQGKVLWQPSIHYRNVHRVTCGLVPQVAASIVASGKRDRHACADAT